MSAGGGGQGAEQSAEIDRLVSLADRLAGRIAAMEAERSAESARESVPIEVTARDTESGDSDTITIRDNYVLITAGRCEQTYVNVTYCADGSETHVITVKGARRA